MKASVHWIGAWLACATILALSGCDPDKQIDAEIAADLARGDYEAARQAAIRYLPADLDLPRGGARLVMINEVESRAYLPQVTIEDGWTWIRHASFVRVRGNLRNGGSKPLRYFEVTIHFRNGGGSELDTAMGLYNVPVPAGAVVAFDIGRSVPAGVKDVSVEVADVRVQ
jgi:hypothetical protein